MDEISRWSPDSDELTSCLPSRPATPQSVRTLLRSQSLRTLGKKLSLTGLSVRSRKTSPGRGECTRLNESHVGAGSAATSLYNRRRPSYRPLSIVVGRPFQLDVNTALDIVQNSLSPERRAATSTDPVKNTPPRSAMKTPRLDGKKTIKPAVSFAMSSPDLSRPATLDPSSSPPQSASYGLIQVPKQRLVTGDIRDLTRLPPPDLSQHPSTQEDPYTAISDAPLLVTTSKKEEIKRMVKEARRKFDEKERQTEREEAEQEEAERQGTVRFKSFPKRGNAFSAAYNNGARVNENPVKPKPVSMEGAMTPSSSFISDRRPSHQTPRQTSEPMNTFKVRNNFSRLQLDRDNEQTHIYDILKEGSPITATFSHQAKTSIDSGKPPTTPASEGSEPKKSGLRKVTGKFKQKPEKSPVEDASPTETDVLHRPDLELFLRRTTNNHSYDYNPGQPYSRHPNTSRAWHSRNLKCTNCVQQCCAVCGRACCAYRAAALAIKIHKENPGSLKIAEERLLQIAFLFPYGQEAPTFLQCTKSDEIGCGRLVCPDCCGECPNLICKDIQCRKCKKDPWSECIWHDGDMSRRAF